MNWIKIGIDGASGFEQLKTNGNEKPILIYGTSIVQGACASRPGMAWTSLLGRKLNKPIVNLGFSGNGRLEPEIIDFISQLDVSIYVLDCMANFTAGQGLGLDEAKKRLKKAVLDIRERQSITPILILEHAGYSDGEMQPKRMDTYIDLNNLTKEVFNELRHMQIPFIYLLKKEEMGLNSDSYVDGTHPNDFGMIQYANACTKKILEILN